MFMKWMKLVRHRMCMPPVSQLLLCLRKMLVGVFVGARFATQKISCGFDCCSATHARAGSVPIVDHCHDGVINGEWSRCAGGLRIHVVFLIGTVFVQDQVFSDIVECISRNVDKFEIRFHVMQHSFGEASQFFSDEFFERCPSPSAHFLYLGVGVAGEG